MRRTAFSLIELLVVISIVTLLIALLLPALTKVRDQARVAQCLSNLRQMGIAAESYATEHRDYLPPAKALVGGASWTTLLRPYVGSPVPAVGTLVPLPIFQCGADAGERFGGANPADFLSYAMNNGQGEAKDFNSNGSNDGHFLPRRVENLVSGAADFHASPAALINLVDSHWWGTQSRTNARYHYTQHYNDGINFHSYHAEGTRANALYFDGHAVTVLRRVELDTFSGRVMWSINGPNLW